MSTPWQISLNSLPPPLSHHPELRLLLHDARQGDGGARVRRQHRVVGRQEDVLAVRLREQRRGQVLQVEGGGLRGKEERRRFQTEVIGDVKGLS